MKHEKFLDEIFKSDVTNMNKTLSEIDRDAFDNAVETILKARRVYVIGIRNSAPLADFLSAYLNLICDNVIKIQTSGSSEVFEQMLRINEKDVVIGISFPRYSMRTIKALEFASSRQAKVITLTDNVNSPVNLYSSCNLVAKSDMVSIMDSLVAPLSVINALITALYMKRKKKVLSSLEELEQIWNEYQVYDADELNPISNEVKMEKMNE